MSNEETIQTDVSGAQVTDNAVAEAPESPASTDPVSRREAKMAALRESRKAEQVEGQREAWLMNNPESTEEDYQALLAKESPPEGEPADEGTVTAPVSAAEDGTPAPADPPATNHGWETVNGVRYKTLMVNGQPKQISEEQYDRMIQKELAGDDKLRRAAQVEQDLNRRQQLLDERERNLQSIQPPNTDAGEALRTAIAKHTELLLEGDVDAANEKMVEIVNLGRASSTPNIDVIADQAATRAVTRVERKAAQDAHNSSINDGWETLKRDYSDVVGDEDFLAFADIQVKKLGEANPDWTPKQVIVEAGRVTREKLKLSGTATPGAVTTTTTSNITGERKQRKSSIRPLPTVSGKRQELKAPAQKDMSPQAKIDRMRAGRVL